MPRKRTIATVLVLTLLVGAVASAQRNHQIMYRGPEVESRVESLMQKIDWKSSFDECLEEAQATGKPIFWLQLVGELDDDL